jgi:hypothetical protein
METQLSVLLYSKYSPMCKKLMNIIESTQINFTSLQTICIDNQKVRERIQEDKHIDITSVPCILVIFPDGVIEKYDDYHSFEWIQQIIINQSPTQSESPTKPQQKTDEQLRREKQELERRLLEKEKKELQLERELLRKENKRKYEQQAYESKLGEHRRRPIIKEDREITKIDELPSEEEDTNTSDRYRDSKPLGHIRENSGNYTHNSELFSGSPTDMRKPKKSAVKGLSKNATEKKSMDLMEKAKQMAKGREETNKPPPPGHPSAIRHG